jgi:hypothetical protein
MAEDLVVTAEALDIIILFVTHSCLDKIRFVFLESVFTHFVLQSLVGGGRRSSFVISDRRA